MVVVADPFAGPAQGADPATAAAEAQRAARAALRAQIARLEGELSAALVAVFAIHGDPASVPAPDAPRAGAAPRLLDLGELERVRDELAHRLAAARDGLAAQRESQRQARAQLGEMRLAPGHHRFRRISDRELGEGGCGVWYVAPRLGLIGLLMDWWEVKHSSGCPLCR
jgi:hypothetical protein